MYNIFYRGVPADLTGPVMRYSRSFATFDDALAEARNERLWGVSNYIRYVVPIRAVASVSLDGTVTDHRGEFVEPTT